MSSIKEVNLSYLYFLIFTAISSLIAFYIVIHAYDTIFALSVSI